MRKNYTKPVFVKTLYISIEMMANTTEEFSLMSSMSYPWFDNDDEKIKFDDESLANCSCKDCPDETSYNCKGCSC